MNGTHTIVAAVVGIDGSGKSSAFRGALQMLAQRVDVVAIGDEYRAGAPGLPVHARTDLPCQRTAGVIARRAIDRGGESDEEAWVAQAERLEALAKEEEVASWPAPGSKA